MIRCCPYCHSETPETSAVVRSKENLPVKISEGDLSLCIVCGEVAVFLKDGNSIRKISDQEQAELTPMMLDIQKALKEQIVERPE